jgi:hypothetical protein
VTRGDGGVLREIGRMNMPFPGMDPYLEHPALWPSVHARLVVGIANELTRLLRPRYVASVEDRVFIEDQYRVPDVWVQHGTGNAAPKPGGTTATVPVIVEVDEAEEEPIPEEVREHFVEVLDTYHAMKVVTVVEVVSPSNKAAGVGRNAYRAKQRETMGSECHLVEIDLLRRGRHVLAVPLAAAREHGPYDYIVSVNRWPNRRRFELFPGLLRERLPRVAIPLNAPDADAPLDLQKVIEQVYDEGGYMFRVHYNEPCVPRLRNDDQRWAEEHWAEYRAAHPEWFPPAG